MSLWARVARGVAALAVLAALLVPLVVGADMLFPYVVSKAVVLRFALTAGLVVLIAGVLTREYTVLDRNDGVLAAWAVFILISGITGLLGVAPMRSIFGELERMWGVIMWFYLLVWYALLRGVLKGREWRWVLAGSVAVACTVAVYALLQRYGVALGLVLPGRTDSTQHGTLGNPSYLGIYTILNTAIALILLSDARSGRERSVWGAAAALLLLVFTLSGARTAFIGLTAGVTVGLAVLLASRGPAVLRVLPTRGARYAAGGAALLALGMIVLGGSRNPLVARFLDAAGTSRTFSVRFAAWEAGWNQFLAAPLLGIGPENFGVAVSRHYPLRMHTLMGSSNWDRAHNGYLEILVASGIVGLLAYLAIWVAYFWTVRRVYVRGGASSAVCAVLAGVGVVYLVYLLMWFDDIASSLTLVLMLAYAGHLRAGGPLVRLGAPRAGAARTAVLLAITGAVLLLFTYQRGYAVWRTARETTAALQARDVESRIDHYHAALDVGAPEGLVVAGLYTDFLRSFTPRVAELRANTRRQEIVWDGLSRGVVEVQRASRLDPHNETWWVDTGRLLLLAAELKRERRYYDASVEALRRAVELSPRRVSLRHLMAEVLLSGGDAAGAHAALDEAMRIDPSVGETHHFRARVQIVEGDVESSLSSVQAALAAGFTDKRDVLGWHLERLERGSRDQRALALLDSFREAVATETGGLPRRLTDEDFEIFSRRPVLALRLGRPSDAVEMAEELSAAYPPARGTIRRFVADVERGSGDAWLPHPHLLSGGRAFGGLALLDSGRR